MKQTHHVYASAVLPASADRVYSIIADYRNGHPRILPSEFTGLTVERGGVGEGTIIAFTMRIFGRSQSYRAAITEPQPGRILAETDLDFNQAVTTFTVEPADQQGSSVVSISTNIPVRGGLLGVIERRITTRVLQRIYRRELEILGQVASKEPNSMAATQT